MAKRDPSQTPSQLGLNLRRLREARGLEQGQLAEKSGLNYVTISRLETGAQQGVSLRNLARLARALGVEVNELTGPVGVSPVADLIERFKASPYARDLRPEAQPEELARIERYPAAVWIDMEPTEATIMYMIHAIRSGTPHSDSH